MLGGYQIINLSNIDLTIGTSQVSITDKDVLAQLRELREHIEDNYNFAIPLNRKLKPVLLRLRDKKNGEKQEVSVWANLSIITNNKTFKIEALVDSVSMKAIQIEVVFQQLTDDDGNPYWDIKTAKYLYTENINIEGGTVEADVLMENIKDEDGNNRFQEWNLSTEEITGVTFTFAKASLSGTHLMFVLSGTVASGTSLGNNVKWAQVKLPTWIYDKIFSVGGGVIEAKSFNVLNTTTTVISGNMYYKKESSEYVAFYRAGTTTASTQDGYFRIQFDLLID